MKTKSSTALIQSNPNLLDDQLIDQKKGMREKKQGFGWSSLTPSQQKIVTWTGIGLGAVVLAVISGKILFKSVRKTIAKKETSKGYGKDKHATWALQIKNALLNDAPFGLGTDELLLRRVLRSIPTQDDWKKVKKSYAAQNHGESLVDAINKDLSTTESTEMLAIIDSKPKNDKVKGIHLTKKHFKNWAKRIHAALSYRSMGLFWGTDSDAIKAVYMEIPSIKAYRITKYEYKKTFGVSMIQDLLDDYEDPYALYKRYIKKLPYSIYDNR